MFASKDTLLTRPSGGYTIARSVRLRSSASAYFNKTPASAGSLTTWTLSMWVKRGILSSGSNFTLFSAGTSGTNDTNITFNGDIIDWFNRNSSSINARINSTQVFRDPSSWYHFVFVWDTTNGTASNRMRLYVNGSLVTSFLSATYPGSSQSSNINNNVANYIAYQTGAGNYFDGYLTEINFIDGQALTPSSFGSTNAITGVWQPIKYTGIYGTNGFYLNFSDNSSNTATTIGKDYSGNGNNWTPNNISVTAGSTYDSMTDVPTLTSATAANYAVLNPLDKSTRITLSNGNLTTAFDQTVNHAIVRASMGMTTGKFYWEVTVSGQTGSAGAPVDIFGVQSAGLTADGTYVGQTGTGMGWGYNTTNVNFYASNFTTSGTPPVQINGTMSVAYDADNGLLWFASAGTYIQGNPSTGSSPSGTRTGANVTMFPAVSFNNTTTGTWNFNFGQQPFVYTPPTGFVALNTYNLPASTITNGAAYMNAVARSGTGATATVAIAFQPDWIWSKCRTNAVDNNLLDSVRGFANDLISNSTGAEDTSNAFAVTTSSTGYGFNGTNGINGSGRTYVDWVWKAGGTSSSNTNGSITSTVSAGATQGFSVVTWTGNGTSGATVGHGLGVTPSMVILKSRSTATNWQVKHTSLNANQNLTLNDTSAVDTAPGSGYVSAISSTTLTLLNGGSAITNVNGSGTTYVAYCFAAVAGYSAFGSYTGNGSTDGPFVFTNFRPRWVMIKRTDTAGDSWRLLDTSRSTYNAVRELLLADSSGAESSGADWLDILSNGFKLRVVSTGQNASGGTYIYACFAENPLKYSLAR